MNSARTADIVRRIVDVVVSATLLVLVLPVLGFAALVVLLDLGTPVLYRQVRPGLHGELFTLYKFRTMRPHGTDEDMLASDPHRLTRVGRFLRATSIDELPQLFNVLRGEMSLVGPRPLLPQYLDLYTERQARRHEVRPGMTGWSQIHGRNAMAWEDRLEMDVWYVEHRSLRLDARILAATPLVAFKGSGVSEPGSATMTPFQGCDDGPAERKDRT